MRLASFIKRSARNRWPVITPQVMGGAVRQRPDCRSRGRGPLLLAILSVALIVPVEACGQAPTVPNAADVAVTVRIAREKAPVPIGSLNAVGGEAAIHIFGEIKAPRDGLVLTPELRRYEEGYQLTILPEIRGSVGLSPDRVEYQVTLGDLPPRDYRLVVVVGMLRLDTVVTVR